MHVRPSGPTKIMDKFHWAHRLQIVYVKCHIWSITVLTLKHKTKNGNQKIFYTYDQVHHDQKSIIHTLALSAIVRPTYHNGIKCKLVLKQGFHTSIISKKKFWLALANGQHSMNVTLNSNVCKSGIGNQIVHPL